VAIDGKAMATLWNGQYIASAVAPGRHVVRITWHLHSDEVVIDVPAGSRRFVETEWKTTPCGAVPSGSCAYTRAAVAPQQAALALLGGMSPAITPSY
jgi:hypothetical protein